MHRTLSKRKFRDLEEIVKTNTNYLRVLQTGAHSQIVAMSIPPGDEIGEESHWHSDLALFVVSGNLQELRKSKSTRPGQRGVAFVAKGNACRFRNTGHHSLKVIAVHTPPEYLDGTLHRTKEQATAAAKEAIKHAWEQ